MFGLLPLWPLWLGLAVMLTAFFVWCVLAAGCPSHYPTRHVGVLFCEDCNDVCDETRPCPCCLEGRG